ncbi:MAG TPA: antibiotic biosynthesis monooxygenase family protein [Paracoccaceae bacterium]|nr:antibiotic biosynthesis monooxygenase family protein [Paracoccaceae bacterium]
MSPVILLNPFEVPPGMEDATLAYWEEAAQILRRQPGYLSTALHQSIDGSARFALVNRAEWESPEAFQAAIASPAFRALTGRNQGRFHYFPGLYRVIRTDADLG